MNLSTDMNGSHPVMTGTVDVPNAHLYYEHMGRGQAVVFIHRGLLDRRMWDAQFSVFGRSYRAIRYDLRGSGESRTEGGTYAHHVDLAAVMDGLGVERADLVGHSLGAAVAIDFALEYPDRVRSLVLAAPNLGGQMQVSFAVKLYQNQLFNALAKMDAEAATELSLKMWVDGPARQPDVVEPAVRAHARMMMADNFSRPLNTYLPKMLEPTAATRLEELRGPILMVLGKRDVPDGATVANLVQERVPGPQTVVTLECGHLVNMEMADEFNRIVGDFLAAQDG